MTRGTRRRVEAVGILLAFPVAIGLTIVVLVSPGAGSAAVPPPRPAASGAAIAVAVAGGDPVPAYGLADVLEAKGYDVVAIAPGGISARGGTEVVYYERRHRSDAVRLRDLIGVGTIRREPVFSTSSDMTIFIGKDL